MNLTGAEIRKTIVIDAPPDVVFRALTDEEELVEWMPQEARMDAHVGGRLEFRYHRAERGIGRVEGEILELIPDKKLSYSLYPPVRDELRRASGPRSSDVVTWSLDELPDGKTRVTLVHKGFTGPAGDAENGWNYNTALLAQYCFMTT